MWWIISLIHREHSSRTVKSLLALLKYCDMEALTLTKKSRRRNESLYLSHSLSRTNKREDLTKMMTKSTYLEPHEKNKWDVSLRVTKFVTNRTKYRSKKNAPRVGNFYSILICEDYRTAGSTGGRQLCSLNCSAEIISGISSYMAYHTYSVVQLDQSEASDPFQL